MKKNWLKLTALALMAVLFALSGCPSGGGGDDEGSPGQAAAPVASPSAGNYDLPQYVTLSSATSGAEIWYTTDGSVPAKGSGTKYSGPIFIGETTTLKAIAAGDGMTASGVLTAAYTIASPQAAAPTANPPAGTYYTEQSVTLTTTTSGAEIWYTTGDSEPAEGTGTKYTAPISLTGQTTIKINAIAVKPGMTDSAKLTASYTIITPVHADDNPSIKNTFGVTQTGTAGVSAAFNAVHAYLQNRTAAELVSDNLIRLGDYIDLEGGLTVEPLPTEGIANAGAVNAANAPITGGDNRGTLLRLIVVGINSFNAQGSYGGNGNGTNAHLVFQFQNIPANYFMTHSYNHVSYKGSNMQAYLVGAGGPEAVTGNFYTGLIAAGVPAGVIYAPKRYVSKGIYETGADLIEDKLWLPTVREMCGEGLYSNTTYETIQNQARLEYYVNDALRIKYGPASTLARNRSYFTASHNYVASTHSFASVGYNGRSTAGTLNLSTGCVPAFCVR
ncbi:MAG: chitobiase/beta-hexosaminidase C-terminal domain-containing protein [Spirochaetales bacterium]|jgi:hypothetical protein|nr:chitobiase/beta-hexosaminidase C-terminal domain-containing protein [Spirochaetales bacterium]